MHQDMLSLRYMFIYLLQSTMVYTVSYTTQFYWKTSTDSAVDYWNHGPIFVPGLQGIYTLSTKKLDIFPPWLTRTTGKIRVARTKSASTPTKPTTELTSITEPTHTTQPTTTELPTTTEQPTKTSMSTRRKCSFDKYWDWDNISKPMYTRRTKTSKTTLTSTVAVRIHNTIPLRRPVSDEHEDIKSAVYYDDSKITKRTKMQMKRKSTTIKARSIEEPFSMFLRDLLKIVCGKRLPELFDLVNSFVGYMTKIIAEGKLAWLGPETTSYITKTIQDIRDFDPDGLRTNCNEAHNMLQQRRYQLTSRTNQLLDYMDDVYDEAEEESMLDVLREASEYPETGLSAKDIAKSFVDEIFLKPMHRVMKTAAGDLLFEMIRKNVQITMSSNRRANIHRKRQVDGSETFRSLRRGGMKRCETKRSSCNELDFLLPRRHSKGHRHKQHNHGSKYSRYNKRKYMKLKRKYLRLKKLIKNETSSPNMSKNITSAEVTDKVTMKPFELNATVFRNGVTPILNESIKDHNINDLKMEQNYDFAHLDATPEKEKMDNNNFLNAYESYDYEDDMKYRRNVPNNDDVLADIHTPENTKFNTTDEDVNYYHKAYEKLHPSSRLANISYTAEGTDLEMELRGNLYDAFRHMDFINITARRNLKYDHVPKPVLQSDSIETDAEAHLKNNIYKVMRKH